MIFAILYAIAGIVYAFKRTKILERVLYAEDWTFELMDVLYDRSPPGWRTFLVVSAFFPLGMALDWYRGTVLDEDDLKPKKKSGKKKAPSKKKR